MAKGMSRNAARFAPTKAHAEVMQFPSWRAWREYARWQEHCGMVILYLSHKTADDGRVFVRFEIS